MSQRSVCDRDRRQGTPLVSEAIMNTPNVFWLITMCVTQVETTAQVPTFAFARSISSEKKVSIYYRNYKLKCAYVEKVSHVGKQGAVNPSDTWQGCPAKFLTGESLGFMSGFVSVRGEHE